MRKISVDWLDTNLLIVSHLIYILWYLIIGIIKLDGSLPWHAFFLNEIGLTVIWRELPTKSN